MIEILFFFFAAVAIGAAINVLLQRHVLYSALSLIVMLTAVSMLFIFLRADFLAVIQIIVYAGAIMVLFVFVIMLLNAGEEERTNISRAARYAGIPLSAVLLAGLVYTVARVAAPITAQPMPEAATRQLSLLLFRDLAFPFELTSVLILIAMVGAMVLAKRDE
jgi:NADH-quinone oxidoreductase subunit J